MTYYCCDTHTLLYDINISSFVWYAWKNFCIVSLFHCRQVKESQLGEASVYATSGPSEVIIEQNKQFLANMDYLQVSNMHYNDCYI